MTDTQLLDEKIKGSGLKVGFIVETLGISRNAFDRKKKNNLHFRCSEIYVLSDLLKLSKSEEQSIFYANEVH